MFVMSLCSRRVVTFNFPGLHSKAWSCAMTPSNITNGFRKCGVYPFDPEAVKPSATSTGVSEHTSDEETEGKGGNEDDGGQKQPQTVEFTAEEALFNHRFEEGFDIFDAITAWLL